MDIKTKQEIAQILMNKKTDTISQEELIDMVLDNSIAVDVDKECDNSRTFFEGAADKTTSFIGSWTFIIMFSVFMVLWIILNIYFIDIDNFPFILLNLLLSCIAALQAPIIMMSQNRENARERKRNQNDYKVDLKSELLLEVLFENMEEIKINQEKIMQSLNKNN